MIFLIIALLCTTFSAYSVFEGYSAQQLKAMKRVKEWNKQHNPQKPHSDMKKKQQMMLRKERIIQAKKQRGIHGWRLMMNGDIENSTAIGRTIKNQN